MSSPLSSVHDNSLGGTRTRLHVAPQIVPAGYRDKSCDESMKTITSGYSSGRTTPELQRIYQRYGEVGRTRRHYGRARDPPLDESIRHGARTEVGEGARRCLQPETGGRMMALMEQQLENAYLSNVRRPLGTLPAAPYQIKVPHCGFGIPTEKSESVKTLLYAGRDVDVLHPVGERKRYGYNWESTGINPTQHRFGYSEGRGDVTVKDVMTETNLVTKLLPKLMTDMRMLTRREVGKGLPFAGNNVYFEETLKNRQMLRSCKAEGDQVRELLSSWMHHPNPRHPPSTKPEGTTVSEGALETANGDTAANDALRSRFLCTFREGATNAPPDATKLDDNVRAHHLLYPCHYVNMGVSSSYFAGGCTLEDVRQLCRKIGMNLTDNQMEEVFGIVAVDGTCGIEQFKNKAVEMGYLA
ncbi:unnamed protein product [Trypanosoma congolense IL3000]|uniref:WGS project CAEQ00000000 data, annotated contig 969 n=1 Tax=Trypanosoma congolense (strain IL3000) TaxID=1068625 RepID=F9WJZ1_TRYCI|nr:unnamed protein product [Trypanosoma congolense IL3000]